MMRPADWRCSRGGVTRNRHDDPPRVQSRETWPGRLARHPGASRWDPRSPTRVGSRRLDSKEDPMGFTVYRGGGTRDSEFQAYVRLLRQRGVDIGKVKRVLEPEAGRRWLYVW